MTPQAKRTIANALFAHDNTGVCCSVIALGRGLSVQLFPNRTEALDAAIELLPNGTVYRGGGGVFFEADGRTVYVVETPFCADQPTVVF